MTDVTVKALAAEIQTPWTAWYSNLLMQGSLRLLMTLSRPRKNRHYWRT